MPSQTHPLSYDDVAARVGIVAQMPLGVQPVRVRRIVGSAGKADKVGADFLPIGPGPASAHFRTILRKMENGEEFPPITVYLIGNRFFVIDGHTRVAAAKQLGIEFLDAEVIECLPRKEGDLNLTFYARKEFERYTHLQGMRLTAPWRYHLLHRHVEGYRLYVEHSIGREVTLPEAARVWYRAQYLPTLLEIKRRRLTSVFGGSTSGDVYTDLLKMWAEDEGLPVSLRELLDRYDRAARSRQGPMTRAARVVTDVVDASLPKLIPSITKPGTTELTRADIDAELAATSEAMMEPDA
jgi:hypothetical protein